LIAVGNTFPASGPAHHNWGQIPYKATIDKLSSRQNRKWRRNKHSNHRKRKCDRGSWSL